MGMEDVEKDHEMNVCSLKTEWMVPLRLILDVVFKLSCCSAVLAYAFETSRFSHVSPLSMRSTIPP